MSMSYHSIPIFTKPQHDVGFMVYDSFGKGREMCGARCPVNVESYAAVIITAAHSLAQRFNPVVGMTRRSV